MKVEIEEIIQKIELKHIEDPTIYDELDKITNMLTNNLEQAITTINLLDENSINWICSSFPEVAAKFKSKKFIDCIISLQKKFQTIDLKIWIDESIIAMNRQ